MDSVISLPEVTLNIIGTKELVGLNEQRVLFVGQKTSDGSTSSGALERSILDVADIDARFGKRSMLSQMLRAARLINKKTQFDAIGLADAGGAVKAAGSIAFSGTATANGTLTFEVASAKNQTFKLDVTSGQTAAIVGTALYALLNADTKAPFTVADDTSGTVTITAANGGTVGNGMLLRVSGTVAGLTTALTAFTAGATDPTLTSVFDVISDIRYQTIVWPGVYTLSTLTSLLTTRFNTTNDVLDGVGIFTKTDTLSNLKTAATGANNPCLVYFGNKAVSTSIYKGSHLKEMNDVVSAEFAAIRSLRLTEDANLADVIVTTSGPLDQFGGLSLATIPYFNSPLVNLSVSEPGTFWSDIERTELEGAGISVIGPNRARNGTIVGQVFTTKTTDGVGNPDTSFKYLNTLDASSVGREYFFNNLKKRYVQSRLTNGDILPGRSIENKDTIRAFCVRLYSVMAKSGVYQDGRDAVKAYNGSLSVDVVLNSGAGKVTITQAPPLVGQLRQILGTIQVSFGTEG